ncbi:MAG TPA: ANTAR domain-containing protein [Streptosporangiaceae bacterium]|nr:ANTAR domain-containing protein [Streptosporangiaceae bacterium]
MVLPSADDAVVRRTKDGWRVGGAELPDLTSAMVLADLLAAELAASEPGAAPPSARANRAANGDKADGDKTQADDRTKEPTAAETSRLRVTIGQLEHALMARVRVEQAIGVLAERHRIQPRQAFEQLRNAARSRGRRVIDIATDVVASATNPLLQLPDELSRPRTANRHARQTRVLGSEGPAS